MGISLQRGKGRRIFAVLKVRQWKANMIEWLPCSEFIVRCIDHGGLFFESVFSGGVVRHHRVKAQVYFSIVKENPF